MLQDKWLHSPRLLEDLNLSSLSFSFGGSCWLSVQRSKGRESCRILQLLYCPLRRARSSQRGICSSHLFDSEEEEEEEEEESVRQQSNKMKLELPSEINEKDVRFRELVRCVLCLSSSSHLKKAPSTCCGCGCVGAPAGFPPSATIVPGVSGAGASTNWRSSLSLSSLFSLLSFLLSFLPLLLFD